MSDMGNDRELIPFLVAGATAGGVVAGSWLMAGYFGFEAPKLFGMSNPIMGWLLSWGRRGDPVTSALFLAVAAGLGATLGGLFWLRIHQRERRLADQSELMGFTFRAIVAKSEMPDLPLFRDWSSARNRMSGRRDDVPVDVLDYSSTVTSRDSDREEHVRVVDRTVVLVPSGGLPDFDLEPRVMIELGFSPGKAIEETSGEVESAAALIRDQFEQVYQLTSQGFTEDQTLFTEHVFTPEFMNLLLRLQGWSIQSRGETLALWRGLGFRAVEEWPDLINDALEIRGALIRAAAAQGQTPVLFSRDELLRRRPGPRE